MKATATCRDCNYTVTVEEEHGNAHAMAKNLIRNWHRDNTLHNYDIHTDDNRTTNIEPDK